MDEKATFINAHVIYLFWAFTGCFILKNWLDALHRLTTCLTTHLSNRNAAETRASWLDVCFPLCEKIKAFSPKFSFTSQIKRQVKRTFASNVFVNKNIPMTAMIRQAPTSSSLRWHFSPSALSYCAVGHSVFVYVSLREESLLLARRCSFPPSSRVKALRHSLGEASTIWIAKKTENPPQAQF